MTATDELREMLDERGIEYEQERAEGIASYTHVTKWKTQTGNNCAFCELEDGYPPYLTRMVIGTPTAEQAVAATLGRGTCHGSFHRSSDLSSGRVPIYHCKAMNKSTFVMRDATYCPLCGGRIEVSE